MARLRILHVITRLDLGGSAETTLLTALGMAKKGYNIDIICGYSDNPPSANEKIAMDCGVSIIRMKDLVRNPSIIHDSIALFLLYRYIRKHRFDLVHTHTSKAGILGRIAAKLANTKCIVHTPHGHIFYGYFSQFVTGIFIYLERFVGLFTDAQITLTNREKHDYFLKGIGLQENIFPIFSGIELAPFLHPARSPHEMRASLGLSETCFVAGTVARLVTVKNHALIVAAAARLKNTCSNIRYVFVGDGELRDSLIARASEAGVRDRFVFAGWRSDIPDLLGAFDIFIMCSKNEGMGRAFVEAQAAGVPVIGTRVGGVEEVIDEGRTGYLVDPDDVDGLAEKIELLYSRRDHRKALSEACKAWVNPKFSAAVMVDEIDKVYRRVLEEKQP
jgi:glycosyltransferase involved in cell wall biosynthesis